MDDDIEVNAEASKIVSSIVGMNEIYIGSYAAQLYVKFLMKNFKFKITDKVFILLLILLNEKKLSLEFSNKEFNEFQVFEKSESNSTKEWFLIRDFIVSTIKDEMSNEFPFKIETKIVDFCKRTDQFIGTDKIKDFITKLNV